MRLSRRMLVLVAAGCSITVAAAAQATGFHGVNPVPGKAPGTAVPLMPGGGLKAVVLAQGSTRLEAATSANPYYGYDGDGPMVPAPGDVPSDGHLVEATKTDPHGSPRSDRARRAGGRLLHPFTRRIPARDPGRPESRPDWVHAKTPGSSRARGAGGRDQGSGPLCRSSIALAGRRVRVAGFRHTGDAVGVWGT